MLDFSRLEPIGWLWNVVYERVYQSDPVMMATFGWGLFLAPVLLVVSAWAVLRGAAGSFRLPRATPPVSDVD